jgi:Tfp pilus assembly protein PilX
MNMLFRKTKSQRGYVLILVMILMLVGSLIITSLLKFTGTGITTTTMYVDKGKELYAADAGIEDGRWRIKNDDLPTGYNVYDYYELSGHSWAYNLQTETGNTPNGYNPNVILRNMWIPTLPIPTSSQAQITLEGTLGSPPKLLVTGSTKQVPTATLSGVYQIKISFSGGSNLNIKSLGVWLPPGFTYHGAGCNNLDNTLSGTTPYAKMYSSENWTTTFKSGQSIIWTFDSPYYPFIGDAGNNKSEFPDVNLDELPELASTITFEFDGPEGKAPAVVSWIDTDVTFAGGLSYSWDGDQKVFQILSTAGDTTVEAYTIKSELRMMAAAIQGDYYATGNTLMYDSNNDYYHIRDTWTSSDHSSSSTISAESPTGAANGIPSDAKISRAFLYWTSWYDDNNITTPYSDSCANYNNWSRSGITPYVDTAWGGSGSGFSGHVQGTGNDAYRSVTLNTLNLTPYNTGRVTVSWDQEASLTATTPILQDNCNIFTTNWNRTTPNSWDVISNHFSGNYDSGDNRELVLNHNLNLSGYTEGDVTLAWSQWETIISTPFTKWEDNCNNNFSNWSRSSTSYWQRNSAGTYFRAHSTGTTEDRRLLTKNSNLDLSGCTGGTVTVSWDQSTSGPAPDSSDGLQVAFSNNGGTTWGSYIQIFTGLPPPGRYTYTFPDTTYCTTQFRMRFRVTGFDGGTNPNYQYLNIDNIRVQYLPSSPTTADGIDFSLSNDGGTTWTTTVQAARGTIDTAQPPDRNYTYTIPSAYLNNQFRIKISLVGFVPDGDNFNIDSILITGPAAVPLDSSDGLDFAFSGDNGASWSGYYQAFRNTPLTSNFSYVVPKDYLTNGFKFQFKLIGFDGTGQYCDITNFKIRVMMPDNTAFFKVNGYQLCYSGSTPTRGSNDLVADKTQVIPGIQGFSYSCEKEVTDLIRYELLLENPSAINLPGIAQYTVGGVYGTKGDNDPNHTQLSHAGWSLIIVYTSENTLGHQLFLYDNFAHAYDADDVDFNGDGEYGGTVSGFIVPEPIAGETNAAKITIMVGEGDEFIAGDTIGGHSYPGDFVAINADSDYWDSTPHYYDIPNSNKLWDHITTGSNTSTAPNNVWNGKSTVFTADGVDVDTFYVPWGSPLSNGLIKPGDTSAHIDLCTAQDNWNLVYIILSFRSEATTGGSVSYLIR